MVEGVGGAPRPRIGNVGGGIDKPSELSDVVEVATAKERKDHREEVAAGAAERGAKDRQESSGVGGDGGNGKANMRRMVSVDESLAHNRGAQGFRTRNVGGVDHKVSAQDLALQANSTFVPAPPHPTRSPRLTDRSEEAVTRQREQGLQQRVADIEAWAQREVQAKQDIVDRLLLEVDKRSDAIRKCGDEIVRLRQKNRILDAELRATNTRLQQMKVAEIESAREVARVDVDESDNPGELRQKLQVMTSKWAAERKRADAAESGAATLRNEVDTSGALQRRFRRLEKAHTAQSKYIQKLQGENAKITVFKTTIRTQEKVIGKLQVRRRRGTRGGRGGEEGESPVRAWCVVACGGWMLDQCLLMRR